MFVVVAGRWLLLSEAVIFPKILLAGKISAEKREKEAKQIIMGLKENLKELEKQYAFWKTRLKDDNVNMDFRACLDCGVDCGGCGYHDDEDLDQM